MPELNRVSVTAVTAFVDWNSQIHRARRPRSDPMAIAQATLEYVGRAIGRALTSINHTARFDVSLRLYHGWHRGFEPTENRKALTTAAAGADFSALSTRANVVVRPEISFGNRLLSALDTRLHPRLGIHLPNTLRRSTRASAGPDEVEEKMVDTAIATDMVDLAHREPDRWIVVLGDDDDLIPPIYAAEAIRGRNQGRVLLVRSRTGGAFFNLDNVVVQQ